jgi:glutamate/tyrosine decarboxylase-like PLP-dependent enzyme
MTSDLFGQPDAYGCMTHGGTDSIFNALFAYRE